MKTVFKPAGSLYTFTIAEHSGSFTAAISYKYDGTSIDAQDFTSRLDALTWAEKRMGELDRTHR